MKSLCLHDLVLQCLCWEDLGFPSSGYCALNWESGVTLPWSVSPASSQSLHGSRDGGISFGFSSLGPDLRRKADRIKEMLEPGRGHCLCIRMLSVREAQTLSRTRVSRART